MASSYSVLRSYLAPGTYMVGPASPILVDRLGLASHSTERFRVIKIVPSSSTWYSRKPREKTALFHADSANAVVQLGS